MGNPSNSIFTCIYQLQAQARSSLAWAVFRAEYMNTVLWYVALFLGLIFVLTFVFYKAVDKVYWTC